MSKDCSNDQTINEQDPTDVQSAAKGLNWPDAIAFNNQPTNLTGLQPSNMPSGFQFQHAPFPGMFQSAFFQQSPYSGILQPSHSIPIQQSASQGTFQCNNYYPPQSTPSYSQSLSYPQPTSTPLNLTNNPESSQRRKKKGGVKGRIAWNSDEDVELCVAWLKISEDPIIGTNQSKDKLWERVARQFNTQMGRKRASADHVERSAGADHVERSPDGCNSRWRLISAAVSKWTGILAQSMRGVPSGWNESMIESQARNTYQQTYGEHFVYEECWKALRDTYKWQTWSNRYGESFASGRSTSSKRKYVQDNDPTDDIRETSAPPSSFHADSPQSVAPRDDAPQSVSVDTPVAPRTTIPVPPMYGPSKMKRPTGGKKAKQRFVEVQSEGAQKISAALLTIDKDVEERSRRAEEARRQRDDFMRLHLEAESIRAKEQHMWEAVSKRTTYVKDLLYVTEKLKDAYRELELMDKSSVRTPREQFDYSVCKKMVEALESQRKVLENFIDTLPVESFEPSTLMSRTATVGTNPQSLDGEHWNVDLETD